METVTASVQGDVQDVGFRDLVETLGEVNNLRGYVYNALDGSVKIVMGGSRSDIEVFLEDVQRHSETVGAVISEITMQELEGDLTLPPGFFKAPTDEQSDIGRKLDEGIHVLRGIHEDTSCIKDNTEIIKEDTATIKDDTAIIKEDTGVIREDTAKIKEDTAIIKEDTGVIREDTAKIKEDTATIKEDTASIRENLNTLPED